MRAQIKTKKIKISDIKIDPTILPEENEDEVQMLKGAMTGKIPVYSCVIPVAEMIASDSNFHPTNQASLDAIAQLRNMIMEAQFPALMGYVKNGRIVCLDCHLVYFAYKQSGVANAPCVIVGTINHPAIHVVKGPHPTKEVIQMFGVG